MKKYIIGIDIGGTAIKAGIFDKNRTKFVSKQEIKTKALLDKKEIINDIHELINNMLIETEIIINDVIGIGIGTPGIIKNNIVYNAFNFKNWTGTNIKYELQKKYPVEIKADNDVNIAALGENYFGAGKNINDFLMVTLGTGIGGGIIINNNLHTGVSGAAGEIGHIKIAFNGRLCSCGGFGCFETYASGTGIVKTAIEEIKKSNLSTAFHKLTENNLNNLEAKHIFQAYEKNDKTAVKILNIWIGHLSAGLANCINILNPAAVIIGGGLSKSFSMYEKKLIDSLKMSALPIPLKDCMIKKADLLNEAGIHGTVSLFL